MTSSLPTVRPVAIATPHYPPAAGGLAAAAARLATGLAAHLPVEVLAPSPRLAPGEVATSREEGVSVVRFGPAGREETARQFFELLTTRGPYRLVHGVYLSETGFLAAYAASHLNIACLVAARGNDLDRDVFRPDRLAGLRFAAERADVVVGVARSLVRAAMALGARDAVYIPNGVDGDRFRPMPPDPALAAALRLEGAFPVIGFFGEARRKKGLPTLLQAFERLHRRYPAAVLVLVGGVRKDDRAIAEVFLARHPEVAPAVRLVPMVPQGELAPYYALMDLLWHPSYQDGLPNAILEGLACERLTIGAAAGGIPDVLEPELLVPPGDAAALVELTERLLADPEAVAAHQRAARREVLERFSPEREVAAYMALYDRIAPASTPSAS